MSFHTEIKGKDIEEQNEDISVLVPFETDHEREQLPLHSLHKVANPYRPLIPPICRHQ